MTSVQNEITTKQRILDCAAGLFAEKGFTETTIRELAEAVSLNSASLYHHFPSKNAILEHMLNDYVENGANTLQDDKVNRLSTNPTVDGILSCLVFEYPPDRVNYLLKVLCVILQEQYRIPYVNKILTYTILKSEENSKAIVDKLKESNALSKDTDPDFWAKMHSSLVYAFASRMALGIGDSAPDFKGMGMAEVLRHLYQMLLDTCGAEKNDPHK